MFSSASRRATGRIILFGCLALICAILAAFEHDDDAGGAGPARMSLGPAQKPFPILPHGFKWPGERGS